MKKLYNTHLEITSGLRNFFNFSCPNLSKPHLKSISSIVFSLVRTESVITFDLAKVLKDPWSDVKLSSVTRR